MSKKMSNANAQEVVVLTKSAAIWNLTKHIGVILICCVAAMALLSNDFGGGSWFMGLFLAGIPFGFRTMKSVIISNFSYLDADPVAGSHDHRLDRSSHRADQGYYCPDTCF